MKKLFLAFSICLCLNANAQLTVFDNGKVHIGNTTLSNIPTDADLTICSKDASIPSLSLNSYGRLCFGNGSGVSIYGGGLLSALDFSAGKMITFNLGKTSVVMLNFNNKTFISNYDIKAPSFLTSSDSRLKKNISSLNNLYEKLIDVNAVRYNLSSGSNAIASAIDAKDSTTESFVIKDDRMHFGFIAQDVQKIYPNLVVEDEDGMLAIDYTGFIPLLVDAYKDLSNKVKEQEDIIRTLTIQRGPSYIPASVNSVNEQSAALKQNKPNPFNSSTAIECTVPQSIASAFICIYDLQGKQVYRIDIRERGEVVSVIDASLFTPGMYIYSLITDGIEIDSKRMIITD